MSSTRTQVAPEEEMTTSADVHTQAYPYCEDLECWCHSDVSYHDDVTHPQPSEEEMELAYQFWSLPR